MQERVIRTQAGFSLIELMVAVTLFAVVMLVAVGALLSLVDANRKARALESVMNNLNIAVDGMVRSMRMGNSFNCNAEAVPDPNVGGDCPNGDVLVSFAPFGSDPNDAGERWVYYFVEGSGETPGQLWRSRDGGTSGEPITAPEVDIEEVSFYVVGTIRANTPTQDLSQPKIVVVIKGTAGGESVRTATTFYIQATAVQRVLDL
ncbi:MAG TPA: type II secretion system protein [Candidatus Paceibacterota bacterium]|nr:type II secretion system protein [Candidatus Paceibacterota bacterium]